MRTGMRMVLAACVLLALGAGRGSFAQEAADQQQPGPVDQQELPVLAEQRADDAAGIQHASSPQADPQAMAMEAMGKEEQSQTEASSEAQQHTDGSDTASTEQHTDGTEQHTDGTEQHTDGTEQHTDGTEQHTDGTEQHTDGTASADAAAQGPQDSGMAGAEDSGTAISQDDDEGAGTSVAVADAGSEVPMAMPEVVPDPFNTTEFSMMLASARSALVGNETTRNVTRAIQQLKELAGVVSSIIPPKTQVDPEARGVHPAHPPQGALTATEGSAAEAGAAAGAVTAGETTTDAAAATADTASTGADAAAVTAGGVVAEASGDEASIGQVTSAEGTQQEGASIQGNAAGVATADGAVAESAAAAAAGVVAAEGTAADVASTATGTEATTAGGVVAAQETAAQDTAADSVSVVVTQDAAAQEAAADSGSVAVVQDAAATEATVVGTVATTQDAATQEATAGSGTLGTQDTTTQEAAAAAAASQQVASATPAPTFAAPPEPLHAQAARWHATGLRVAAQAAFTLTALRSAGILPVSLPRSHSGDVVSELHQLALAGSTEASMSLADRFFSGVGVQRSCSMGVTYARMAAAQLTAEVEKEARFAPAISPSDLRERHINGWYVSHEDMENANHVVNMEEDMALRGNPDAQRRMAYRRLMGRGIEADPEGAFHDFVAGANQGDPYALFNLGYMYLKGLFVAQNYTEAHKLFLQSAHKGFAPGWNGLGVMHWHGQGGPVNMSAAVDMFRLGAKVNQSDALYNLGALYLSGHYVEKNETHAAELFIRADLYGHWRAAYQVAAMYEQGIGLPQNCSEAELWYRKYFRERSTWGKSMTAAHTAAQQGDHWGALVQYLELAEQGSAAAATNAAWMLRQGLGYSGPGFLDMASRLYERAARQGHNVAAVELGHMVLEADEIRLNYKANPVAALSWWSMAAHQNDSEALYLMGWAHQHGVGLPDGAANRTHARSYYLRAVKSAKGNRGRAAAPHLALFGMAVDDWLAPLFGPGACTRLFGWLGRRFVSVRHEAPATGGGASRTAAPSMGTEPQQQELAGGGMVAAGAAARDGGEQADGAQSPAGSGRGGSGEAWWRGVERAGRAAVVVGMALWRRLGLDQVSSENVLMTICLGSLAMVLLLRRRQLVAHVEMSQRLQGMASLAGAEVVEAPDSDSQGMDEAGGPGGLDDDALCELHGMGQCGHAGCAAAAIGGGSSSHAGSASSGSGQAGSGRAGSGQSGTRHPGSLIGPEAG